MANGTVGVGGKTIEQALGELSDMTSGVPFIEAAEFKQRLAKLQTLMQEKASARFISMRARICTTSRA